VRCTFDGLALGNKTPPSPVIDGGAGRTGEAQDVSVQDEPRCGRWQVQGMDFADLHAELQERAVRPEQDLVGSGPSHGVDDDVEVPDSGSVREQVGSRVSWSTSATCARQSSAKDDRWGMIHPVSGYARAAVFTTAMSPRGSQSRFSRHLRHLAGDPPIPPMHLDPAGAPAERLVGWDETWLLLARGPVTAASTAPVRNLRPSAGRSGPVTEDDRRDPDGGRRRAAARVGADGGDWAHLCEGNVIEARRRFDNFADMLWTELGCGRRRNFPGQWAPNS
jgi:hypothetical protein